MRGYTQLAQEERFQIYILKKAEYSQAQIAELLERDKSTISRELRLNQGLRGYRPKQAYDLALIRRYGKVQPRIGSQVWQQVETLVREEWSPEQLVGRVAMEQGGLLAMNGSISIFMQTWGQAATCTVFCVTIRFVASAMASIAAVAAFPTWFRLTIALPLSIASGASATGRMIP